jgi:hypothetical protein
MLASIPEEPSNTVETDLHVSGGTSAQPLRRSTRIRKPVSYRDILPPPATTIPRTSTIEPNVIKSRINLQPSHDVFETPPNELGLYRIYPERPSRDPELAASLDSVSNSSNFPVSSHKNRDPITVFGSPSEEEAQQKSIFAPFLNVTVWRLMKWWYTFVSKSKQELQGLVSIFQADDFEQAHLDGFSATSGFKRLEKFLEADSSNATSSKGSTLPLGSGWRTTEVKQALPCKKKKVSEDKAPQFTVGNVVYRPILDVIRHAYKDPSAAFDDFHLKGFTSMWKPDEDSPAQRVHAEVYSSNRFLALQEEIRQLPVDPSKQTYERSVAALMIHSDSTHLTNFGTSHLWPFYNWFGNQTKYDRATPSMFTAHHFCYAPSVRTSNYNFCADRLHITTSSRIILMMFTESISISLFPPKCRPC